MAILNKLSAILKTPYRRQVEAEKRRLQEEEREKVAQYEMEEEASECENKAERYESRAAASFKKLLELREKGGNKYELSRELGYYRDEIREAGRWRQEASIKRSILNDKRYIEMNKKNGKFLDTLKINDVATTTAEMIGERDKIRNLAKAADRWAKENEDMSGCRHTSESLPTDDEIMAQLDKELAGRGKRLPVSDDEIKRGVADGLERVNKLVDEEDKR